MGRVADEDTQPKASPFGVCASACQWQALLPAEGVLALKIQSQASPVGELADANGAVKHTTCRL